MTRPPRSVQFSFVRVGSKGEMLAGSRCFPLRPNSDIAEWGRHVRSVPSADLLNHLVGDNPDQARLLMFSVADWIRWQ
jgi:hypothetical protein